jgi:hypothetical protein
LNLIHEGDKKSTAVRGENQTLTAVANR